MKQIIDSILSLWEANEASILITIIEHKGSTPRGVGTQMLVGKNGLVCGTIGGGAIEKEAISRAIFAIEAKESFLKDYELNLSDTKLNMVCGGALSLHFLYIDKSRFENSIRTIESKLSNEEPGFMVIDTKENTIGFSDEAFSTNDSLPIALPVPERVIVFGGGHVSRALVPVLNTIGFKCVVLENRKEFANESNFPDKTKVILCEYESFENSIKLKNTDYVVVMSHGHTFDYVILEKILRNDYTYVGVIGSRRKKASVNERLRLAGISEEKINAVHAPIGLPIGAVTPEEIAISIASEMIRVRAISRGMTGEKVGMV